MLTLEPGEHTAPLKGRLNSIEINEARDYEPLSYVWGDPARTHSIICEDVELQLTSSVYYALQRLRLPHAPRRLWVDQICINQENLEERSQQVQFMNTIYRKATRVLVWHGRDVERVAELAFELVRRLVDTFGDHEKRARFDVENMHNLTERTREEWNPLKALTRLLCVS